MLSIIIVTYNRCCRIAECLRSIHNCLGLGIDDELIVVDDGSTDTTKLVVANLLKSITSCKTAYVQSANHGSGAARTLGCKYATNQWLLFIDDDAKLMRGFITELKSTIQRVGEQAACIGGPIVPYYTCSPPHWFKDEYEIRSWGPVPRWLVDREVFSGSNMAWKRASLLAIGAFQHACGMRAGAMGFGEDTQAFLTGWETLGGNSLYYYNPALIVEHWCPAYKFDLKYKLRRNFLIALTHWQAQDMRLYKRCCSLVKLGIQAVMSLGLGVFGLIKGKDPHNVVFEELGNFATFAGAATGCLTFKQKSFDF